MPTGLDWRLRPFNNLFVLAAADAAPDVPVVPDAPPLTIDQQLREWTVNEPAWEWAAVTPHSSYSDVVASAQFVWPDLSAGTYTLLTLNTAYRQWDSFRVTHAASGKTGTRTVKGRDSNGAATGYTLTIT